MKPDNLHSSFVDRLAQYLTNFLYTGCGKLDLKRCLNAIPTNVAPEIEYNNLPNAVVTI